MDFKLIYSSDHVAVICSDKRLNNDHVLQWHQTNKVCHKREQSQGVTVVIQNRLNNFL